MSEKLLSSQKYFLFKLSDVLNNSFHTFEEKRAESIRLLIRLCIDTYEEMHESSFGADKLVKAYSALLKSLAFQINRHPFRKTDMYKKDFGRICILSENPEIDKMPQSYELFLGLNALLKKLNEENLVERYIECLKNEMQFAEVDILIDALISELLYEGYSLKYINEWYYTFTNNDSFHSRVRNGEMEALIDKLKELDGKKKEYEIVVPYTVKAQEKVESARQLLEKNFQIFYKDERSEFANHAKWKDESTFACKKVLAADCYKAMKLVTQEFATSKELFSMWQGRNNDIKNNIIIGCIYEDEFITEDIRTLDNKKLISYYDKNRVEQVNSFIALKSSEKNEDIDTLERILHTLHNAKSYSIQTRYLNFWSALEYALYPFPRNSIIEKARVVVPEAFSLFYIKNKMNIFWERMKYAINKKDTALAHIKCKDFIDTCVEKDGFNTIKIIEYLQDEVRCMELLQDVEFHIVLKRELMELVMLVTDPKKLRDAIEEYHDEIEHDLDIVYRLRNKLIHSAKGNDESLEHIGLRLYRYVNSIAATILYYKKKNGEISIVEILNSLHNTYNVYIETLESWIPKKNNGTLKKMDKDEGYAMVRPQYIYLE